MKKVGMNGGIYAIKADEEILYIGKALTDLDERYKQHKNCFDKGKEHYGKIYEIMEEYKKKGYFVHFCPLIKISDLQISDKEIDERELELMELALIHIYQPIGNIQGVERTYSLLKRN